MLKLVASLSEDLGQRSMLAQLVEQVQTDDCRMWAS